MLRLPFCHILQLLLNTEPPFLFFSSSFFSSYCHTLLDHFMLLLFFSPLSRPRLSSLFRFNLGKAGGREAGARKHSSHYLVTGNAGLQPALHCQALCSYCPTYKGVNFTLYFILSAETVKEGGWGVSLASFVLVSPPQPPSLLHA